jgi:dipeptidyl aminopeptidase/acylaminoacyl peptidase
VLNSDLSALFTQYWFEGKPWDDLDNYMKRSPISYVGNVTTPTMLLTGEEDYRTPISETEQYYKALKLQQVETAMVRIPGASHGIAARPSNLVAKIVYILKWFEVHGK